MDRTRLNIVLIEAPFGPVAWPSIGTSLLKTRLNAAGHRAEVKYLSLAFLRWAGITDFNGLSRYQDVCDSFGIHLGEWIFGKAAFPDADWDRLDPAYMVAAADDGAAAEKCADARAWRQVATAFVDHVVESYDWAQYDVLGFANSYSQLNASIALANRIRARHPQVRLIMGGCGCADPMGLGVMRICAALDAVVMGEGDDVVAPLCEAVAQGQIADLPGVLERKADGTIHEGPPTERVMDANSLPVPDYGDYYRDLPAGLRHTLPHYLPIEASRGCWWGAKHHCTFCGLSPTKMPYFRKDADRFLGELREQTARYHPPRYMAVDNIMPHEYYTEVCPHVGAASGGAEIFFEVKANLDRPIIRSFAQNNISQIQPGIESLSTPVLKLMKKGTTGIFNVYMLRLAEEFGLRVHWSILFGFEGEKLSHYQHQIALSRRIRHLRPPLGLIRCEVERYAPMYRFPDHHGLINLRPSHFYSYCHPVADEDLALLAYRFDADRTPETQQVLDDITREASEPVQEWQSAYAAGGHKLTITPQAAGYLVTRQVGDLRLRYHLRGAAAQMLPLLDRPNNLRKLGVTRHWTHASPYLDTTLAPQLVDISAQVQPDTVIDTSDPDAAFLDLLAHGLVVEEDGLAVSVALFPADEKAIPQAMPPELQSGLAGNNTEMGG